MIHIYGFEDNIKIHKINIEKYKKYSILNEHELDVDDIFLFNQNYILKAKSISEKLSNIIKEFLFNMKRFSDNKFICAMFSIKKKYDFSCKKIDQLFAYLLKNKIFGYRKIIQISRFL